MQNMILVVILTLLGCNNSQKSNIQNHNLGLAITDSAEVSPKNLETSLRESVSCLEFSEAMNDFIMLLKQDNYAIYTVDDKSELSFKSYTDDFKVDKLISFNRDNFKTILAKRKHKLEKMTDHWYPSFSVTEICFSDEQTASKYHREISEIINGLDSFNEKNYDYILKNDRRLIYVSCGAKIFESYAMAYKAQLAQLLMYKLD